MKNKGFTLIELIAVIVIMGMILLIVFPATSRLMRDNEEREYETYYELAEKGVELYARTRRDDIGGVTGSGCIDDKTLTYLIESEYVKAYEGKKDVECKTPNEYSTGDLVAMGVDTSKEYVNIRVENEKGKIKTQFSMICKKKNKSKAEYINLIEKKSSCNRYVAEISNSLVKTISDSANPNKIPATFDKNNTFYVNNTATNNYVWYSGKMWRIVSYNTNEKTMKLVTDENISIVTYNSQDNVNFRNSNIYLWLNNVFLKTLRNPDKYILDASWNYTAVSNANEPARTNEAIAKVGLLNYYEYSKVGGGFLNIGKNYWLLSNHTTANKVWYINSSTASNTSPNTYLGVRPSIVLKSNLTFIPGGTGTENNPYRLTGDVGANVGAKLNTRYAGEYVKINDILFRIVEVKNETTKLVSDEPLVVEDQQFHYFDKTYSSNTSIGIYLNEWKAAIQDYLVEGDFCKMLMTTETPQTLECPRNDILNIEVAIPKIGEMFTTNANKEYWTLTNATEDTIYTVEPDGTLRTKTIEEKSGVRASVYIKENITITGGNGTKNSPYTIE